MQDALVHEEETRPGVTVLTLNRPGKRNALNIPMLEALSASVARASTRPEQRVLILRGAGAGFCAGLDLKEALDPAAKERSGDLVRETLEGIYRCPCATVAVVHGSALAGGAGLMAACDLAIATVDSAIGFPEVRRGLVASLVMTFLRRQVPERFARELLLLGEVVEGERAAEIGLVNRAVPVDMLDAAVEHAVDRLLKTAPGAIRDTKALFDTLWNHPIEDDLDAAAAVHARMRASEEAREGMQAFLEKRKPAWES